MDQLFVEIEIISSGPETEILTTVSSFITLYVYRYLQSPQNVKLNFVRSNLNKAEAKLKLRSQTLRRELTEERIICKSRTTAQSILDLKLPVYVKDGMEGHSMSAIAGMSAVCRELVLRQGDEDRRKLLGFKESCLLAPAETSIWTRFCEVNVVEALNRILTTDDFCELPQEVPRFEKHMNEPVRMHNIYKLARESANKAKTPLKKGKIIIDCNTPKELLLIEHRFAEGIAFTIADLILYPCFRLIFLRCQGVLEQFPLLNTWLCEIDSFEPRCYKVFQELHTFPANLCKAFPFKIPDCESSSLYKSDPRRYKPRNRIYTDQSAVDAALAKLQALQMSFNSDSDIVYNHMPIDWLSVEPHHAKNSALPQERLVRKRQQLENLANSVAALATNGDRIVDFCSGTGHLGLLLALQLPNCTVILMENKAISLEHAKRRAAELKLKNCLFYQCNIDYFEGQFEIGTALHACGTATDIVLRQCMRSRARFVCCPCCYGSLQPMPHISYPLSKTFRKVLTEKDLLHIAHTADQAHELGTLNCKPEITRQGQLCMDILDTDRKLMAEEEGYEVILTRLKPETCTPKNHLLVGTLCVER